MPGCQGRTGETGASPVLARNCEGNISPSQVAHLRRLSLTLAAGGRRASSDV